MERLQQQRKFSKFFGSKMNKNFKFKIKTIHELRLAKAHYSDYILSFIHMRRGG